jgi:hypothetical protein
MRLLLASTTIKVYRPGLEASLEPILTGNTCESLVSKLIDQLTCDIQALHDYIWEVSCTGSETPLAVDSVSP